MAFLIKAKLENYEVRNVSNRTTKKGNPWRAIRVESADGDYTAEVAVWDEKLFPDVDTLSKGDVVDMVVRASGASDYQGVSYFSHEVKGNAYEIAALGGEVDF